MLIIDEAHTYFRDYKGSDPQTKKLAALAAENARLVEDLVKKGRSVGILVILTTQKTTGDAIPTFIRDVCPVGLSFAQKTAEAAVAALGEDIRNWPDANPITLQDPAYVGVAVDGHQGATRLHPHPHPLRARRGRGPHRRRHRPPDRRPRRPPRRLSASHADRHDARSPSGRA